MVWKGSAEDSEGFKWIQEVESFKKRQEVPGKCFWMLEVSGGLEKYMDASKWCREAGKVRNGIKFRNQECNDYNGFWDLTWLLSGGGSKDSQLFRQQCCKVIYTSK